MKIGKVEFDVIKILGDGNCFYCFVFLILVGNEDFYLLLRFFIVIELFLYVFYYVRYLKFFFGMKLFFVDVLEDIMFILCFFDIGMKMWESIKCREDVIKREVVIGCRVFKWSVMVYLMVFINVIGRIILLVFFKDCLKIRLFFYDEIIFWECFFYVDLVVMFWLREGSFNIYLVGWY